MLHRAVQEVSGPQHHDATRLGIWERAQQHCIHDAEHGRARADRERQRRDDDSCDHRAVSQIPHCVPHVLTDGLQPDEEVRVARSFMRTQQAAEPPFGIASRLVPRHARCDVVAGSLLDVELQLCINVSVQVATAKDVHHAFDPSHG